MLVTTNLAKWLEWDFEKGKIADFPSSELDKELNKELKLKEIEVKILERGMLTAVELKKSDDG